MPGPGIRLTGAAELRSLGRELRDVGDPVKAKGFRKTLRVELNRAAKPVRDDLKREILAIPAKPGGRSTGLRKRMARAVKTKIATSGRTAGVRVFVDSKALAPAGQERLPALLDGSKDFRHPVFGRKTRRLHRTVWASQKARPFSKPVRDRHQSAAHDAAVAAIERVAAQLEGK